MRALLLVGVLVVSCSPPPTPEAPKGPPPNGGRIALECEAHGVRAFDASRTLIPGVKLRCTAHAADRTGAPVDGANVVFLTEAGRVTSSGVTAVGVVDGVLETSTPLPKDTDPEVFSWTPVTDVLHTGELLVPTWMVPDRWSENPPATSASGQLAFTLREPRRPDPIRFKPDGSGRYRNNPRDNLVTLIAVLDGEEGFTDSNGNGTFDVGESFIDLTEPFVDSNDNGTWDADEQFIDVNGNRQWDGRNGAWDAHTKLWVMERVLWTGVPAQQDLLPVVAGVVGHRPSVAFESSSVALTCPGVGTTCTQAQPTTAAVFVSDPWFNAITRLGATDDCQAAAANTLPVTVATVAGPGARALWPSGERIELQLSDRRDGTQSVDRRSPPLGFTVNFACHYTGQPGGTREELLLGALNGTIE